MFGTTLVSGGTGEIVDPLPADEGAGDDRSPLGAGESVVGSEATVGAAVALFSATSLLQTSGGFTERMHTPSWMNG